MICEPGSHTRKTQLRLRATDYLVRHPDVAYCDDCLYQLAADEPAEHKRWGDISIERADGVCARCKRRATVSAGRRTGSLADFAPRGNGEPGEQRLPLCGEQTGSSNRTVPVRAEPTQSGEPQGEPRVMDLVIHALLLAKRDALKQARKSLDQQIEEIEREIGVSA